MLLEISGENNSRKNEEMEPKQNQHPVVDVTVDRSKVRCCKREDITLPTKVHLVKAMVFPVVMYSCESWTVKKAECQRIDVFELWCLSRLLRVHWTGRRSNQSILKEISPGCSLEGLMLKAETPILWPPHAKS